MKITITKSAFWLFIKSHDFALWWKPLQFCHYTSFVCKCGRRQSKNKNDDKFAEMIGWRKINNNWTCPICCNNTAFLDTIFGDN